MIKVVNLCDNNSISSVFRSEHGLCYYIEAYGQKILFDTGQTDVFLDNSKKFNLDLNNTDAVVLSHGHYDHVGGLSSISGKKIYCSQELFVAKYKLEDNQYKYIGIPFMESSYRAKQNHEFIFIKQDIQISKNIYLLTNFQKSLNEFHFYVKKDGKYIPDDFQDEVALVIDTPKGILIFTGCAHSGIINITEKAWQYFDQKNIYGLFGGFHLSKLGEPDLIKIAAKMEGYNICKIGLSHCTGDKFINYLHGDEVFNFSAGQVLEL